MRAELEFITGRAGSGKTEALFSRIAGRIKEGAEKECILIVPEQATFETEKRLSEYLSGGLFGVTVTSWSGLARKSLDALGDRRAYLSPQGRVMLMRRSAEACAGKLTVFSRSAASSGFPAEMDGLIAKFKRCGMDPEAMRAAADKLPGELPLKEKLYDIALVFEDQERRCAERYIDPEDMMNELLRRLPESPLAGAHVFIDGADTLHDQAYPLFSAMLRHASSVTAAIELDSVSRDRALFAPSAAALYRLEELAKEAGVTPRYAYLGGRKRPGTPAILHLEKELFALPARAFPCEPEGLEIVMTRDREDEVEECAEAIRRAVSEGLRYRDISVTVSDLAGYAGVVSRVFSKYGIPYFTDVKRTLLTHPTAQMLLCALRACESGFAPEHVLGLVKSGCAQLTPEEAERFENHLLAKGYFGSRLREPFTGESEPFEDIRRRVMEPLTELHAGLLRETCENRARAIHGFMERLQVYEKQEALCSELHEKGMLREEEENAQVFNTVLEVLDQLFVIMGDETIGLSKFISVLKEGLAAYEVGVIPTTADQVLVGSMDRTRSREVRRLFVLGMNDGLFPRPRTDDGVIDDGDLARLRESGVSLWRTSASLAEGDLLTVYSALSKATERITFSYPAFIPSAGEDSSAAPCRLISNVKRIFPNISVTDLSLAPGPRSNERLAFASLARRLRRAVDTGETDEETAPLFAYFSRSPEYRAELRRICSELHYARETPDFGRELALKLYGKSGSGSASRLEAFNRCPFMHFARYGLCAKERDERSQKVTDRGSFFHAAIEAYVKYVTESGLDWGTIDDEKTREILREIVPPIMNEGGYLLFDTARQRAQLSGLVDSVIFTCCAVTRHIARGSFRPFGCEVGFGRPGSLFPALKVETASGVTFSISGIIDRIDSFESASGPRSRIIDYKSGGKDFNLGELEAGIQLQLPLYAAAINAAQTVGMYYMPISDIAVTTDENGEAVKELTEELLKKFRLSGLSLRDEEVLYATEPFEKSSTVISAKYNKEGEATGAGLVSEDEYSLVVEAARKRAAATLERIYEGVAAVSPYENAHKKLDNACRFCPYGDICR
ncbi:MAG: PD-(D/E)XK nuclease family protein, partial [Clostridia bacterium]|nr:PD-(D/E)XK nuclease family protein [Clostridia bacterium]